MRNSLMPVSRRIFLLAGVAGLASACTHSMRALAETVSTATPAVAHTPQLVGITEYAAGVRVQVKEVIVRQAMAGAPWQFICAGPMQLNNLTVAEIEEEVMIRKLMERKHPDRISRGKQRFVCFQCLHEEQAKERAEHPTHKTPNFNDCSLCRIAAAAPDSPQHKALMHWDLTRIRAQRGPNEPGWGAKKIVANSYSRQTSFGRDLTS